MTTKTTTTPARGLIPLPERTARLVTAAGALATTATTGLAWTWSSDFPGDLTYYFSPAGLQVVTLVGGVLTLLFALAALGIRGLQWLTPAGRHAPTLLAALATFAATWFTLIAIAVHLNGLINLEPGGALAAVTSLITLAGALALPPDQADGKQPGTPWQRFTASLAASPLRPRTRELPSWAEILIIAAAFAAGLLAFTYGIDTDDGAPFVGYLIFMVIAIPALNRAGLIARLTALTRTHRGVALGAAFIAAACFPFTQDTDQYTIIGANILIFATVALGLNVVVGLAGLLDLGYVAFLGVGAYAAALVSGSPESAFGLHFPFWAALLTGAAASLVFGVLIGAPTLRLRGDYLAIVTLGFGEIFRIAMLNLNGTTGPDVTNGAMGIPNIPNLEIFGFNFGEPHDILGIPIATYGNYYLLMILVTAFVVLVFRRAAASRIGRAWIAIREDETAAIAMGINSFRLRLLAFALGAALAGLAGTVHAHVVTTATPEQFQFAGPQPPNSAFLLAAVILGGMGTLSGPLVGAALLFLIPAKLDFLQDYQLLLFGIALVLLMRFRPEGLIPDRRKQLEFHETGQLDVPDQRLPDADATLGATKAKA
ncbi:branched-chain amino acid ABC transporter permease [Streptomyces libani]|uniref:Branched-chain amino acid ABC transporter permease n=1 Tax=Streptomyces nigrescens TaxID=1920 RepID=A0A640TQF9_STRNI|nr:branched-chain amino acid ABC transporter permease [Streptomyces libani]WAT99609.1 branched-chain amino acid ABC transporter permease [Streptomyces libani subsp. libani]GFE26223.1 branched-chain amino acid ABC transporter permease [Streptomyces libani subsp. libani]GGW08587.1 branched-chain amino acid ABC transporter permease [Streptomyces libani subsp. libani]